MDEIFSDKSGDQPPLIWIAGIAREAGGMQQLDEGKWIDGRYPGNIRIDRNTHFASVDKDGVHGHVFGRKDRIRTLVAVNLNGTASHGLKGKLHDDDADALRRIGFEIPLNNIVEYIEIDPDDERVLLFG